MPASRKVTVAAISERWRVVERGFLNHLSNLPEEELSKSVTYTNFSAETWGYRVWMILLHVVNHQTYHRGQVTTLLRQLGAHPVAVDLLAAEDYGLCKRGQRG